MMNAFRCYTREELNQFMLGKLPAPKAEEIAEHLDHCSTCEDTVVGLEKASDTLVNLLAGSDADASSAAYQKNPDYDRAATAAQQVINSWMAHNDSSPQCSVDQQKIGDYEIIQTLARGGMGSVFRARHTRLEKEVAIKILPERKMQSPDAIARFSREMKIVGQMSHPAMVAATDAGAADGIHYLVMELVDGFDLGKLVGRCGPLAVADACELIRQSALGIQYAHEQDVVHRDVKPSNLMLSSDSKVKVLDLGLATLGGLTGTVDELTTVGQLMGTLDYMAPEQCGDSQPIGPPCDVYGLGATLYKLIAGEAPYSSPENDTPLKKLRAMATCEPTPIDQRVTGLPEELVSIINRCLADLPTDRFDSAADLATALEPLCVGHDLPGLLQRANSATSQSEASVPRLHNPGSQKQLNASTNSKAKLAAVGAGNSRRWISTAIGLAFTGFAILGGILIYLNTTAGQLIIESDVEDVRVTVMKNDLPTKDVQVEQGSGSTKLWAGEYQIVIESDSEQLEIDNETFVLRRGETVVAKITKKALGDSGRALSLDSATERKVVAGDPTYDSKGIEHWIELKRKGISSEPGSLEIIHKLAPLLSDERKKEVVERHLEESKHEVSPSFHASLAVSLAPLCDSEELFDKLFDHVCSRTAPNILEPGSPERFQARMLKELKSEERERQAMSIQWAEQNMLRGRPSPKGKPTSKGLPEQQLLPGWKAALLKRIDNPDQQKQIMTVLVAHFRKDSEVVKAIYKCVSSDEYSFSQSKADKLMGDTEPVYYLLETKPKDEVIPIQAAKWLKNGSMNPEYFAHLVFSRYRDSEDRRLIDQLNQALLDGSWGLSLVTTSLQPGARFPSTRRRVLEAIAQRQLRGTRDLGWHAEVIKPLLPAIYKQFEFKFAPKPKEPLAAKKATQKLHQAANKAIASLTARPATELCKGYDIMHWAEAFASAKSESAKIEVLYNMNEIRNSKKVPDDFVLLIVQGANGLSFDHFDTSSPVIQGLAIDLFRGNPRPSARTKLPRLFVDSLDQLTDEDAMFAFWVLRQITHYQHLAGNEHRCKKAVEYAKRYQWSDNYLLRSRAIDNIFKYAKASDSGIPPIKWQSSCRKILGSVLADESLSNRQKLRGIQSYAFQLRYVRDLGEYAELKTSLFKLVRQIEDPRELATVFFRSKIYGSSVAVMALDLIAKNPDYLHQVHQPLSLSCWNTPEQEENFSIKSNKTLLELCLTEIESRIDEVKRSDHLFSFLFENKAQTERVLTSLEATKTFASDVQRNRIEQIIKRIESQSKADDKLKISYDKQFSIENVKELADGSSMVRVSLTRIETRTREKKVTKMKTVKSGSPVRDQVETVLRVPQGEDVDKFIEAFIANLNEREDDIGN